MKTYENVFALQNDIARYLPGGEDQKPDGFSILLRTLPTNDQLEAFKHAVLVGFNYEVEVKAEEYYDARGRPFRRVLVVSGIYHVDDATPHL